MIITTVIGPDAEQLFGCTHEPYKKMTDLIEQKLEALAQFDQELVIKTGCEPGTDQIAFWAALRVKKKHAFVRLIVLTPYTGYASSLHTEGAFSQKELKQMLSHADIVREYKDQKKIRNRADAALALAECKKTEIEMSDIVISVVGHHSDTTVQNPNAEYALEKHKAVYELSIKLR